MSMAMEEPLLSSPTATTTTTSSSSSSSTSASFSSSDNETTANPTATTPAILARLTAILTLVVLALWANHEASKGVDISIINSAAKSHAAAAHLFHLKFVSNGRAYRITHRASQFVEQILYPDEQYPRKPVDRITLQLAGVELASATSISADEATGGDYTIHLSPILMSVVDADAALAAAVQRAVARVWLWDGRRTAPEPLLDAVAEYLAAAAGFGPISLSNAHASSRESNGSSCWSAEFLQYGEARQSEFVAALNRGMRQRWSELTEEDAFGSPPIRHLCAAYKSETGHQIIESFNTTSAE
ncbi:hypothetical protein Cni_G00221 [Canna indica]|uniref:Uncharacterized protein n=1 Tax=Canna indica TaxID=4628 RepID=A0AAQ3PW68_9LILI|nr:hypothetical protein Cni_G00221 [Canna indica]